MTYIPASFDEVISPAWLSTAISERYPGARVASVQTVDVVHAVATRARIAVTYEGSQAAKLPTRLFVKGGFAPDTQHLLEGGAYYREARFYRDLAEGFAAGLPFCVHASVQENSRQGLVILEDLSSTGAQLYTLGGTHSVATVSRFVDSLAWMHAVLFKMLENGSPSRFGWIQRTADVVPRLIRNDPLSMLVTAMEGERGTVVPEPVRNPARILSALRTLIVENAEGPTFLLHGDVHLGNMFTSGEGCSGLYDWQTLQRGSWAMDVVYYIVGSLEPNERRAHLQDLLSQYIRGLACAGGPAITIGEAMRQYRRYLAYGLFIWSVARDTIVPLEILKKLLHRFAIASDEADTFCALSV